MPLDVNNYAQATWISNNHLKDIGIYVDDPKNTFLSSW